MFQKYSDKTKTVILGVLGLILFVVSTYFWLKNGNVIFVMLHLLGISILLEALVILVGVRNIFRDSIQKFKYLTRIFVLGGVVGIVFLDFISVFLFGIWEYNRIFSPRENVIVYFLIAFIAWGFYFLIFHQSYQLFHKILHKRYLHQDKKSERFFPWVGVFGLGLLLVGVTLPKLNIEPFFAATLSAFGGWFILEGFELPRKRPTLLSDILNGNFRPLIAIFLGAVILGFISEYTNIIAPVQQWIYYGVPWQEIAVAGVPISLLFSWVWMYILFLSLEKVVFINKEEFWE